MRRLSLTFLFLLLFITIGCHQQTHQAGICLSFDDRSIKEWYGMRDLLNQYHAHVTFFVTQFDSLSPDEIKMLRDLQNDGNEIASHGALHVQAESYIKSHSYKDYLANEIDPSIASMKKNGFDPVSFAYPYGSKYWFTDYLLLKKFRSTRGVSFRNKRGLKDVGDAFYDFDGNRKLSSIEIDGTTKLSHEEIIDAMNRASEKKEVLLLSGHVPLQGAVKSYTFEPSLLEFILNEAQARHLVTYRIRDLSPNQN